MKNQKYSKKMKEFKSVKLASIQFEIEENALELMEEHLALFTPRAKEADKKARQNSRKKYLATPGIVEIDLHGLTLEEAEKQVAEVISRQGSSQEKRTFKIITGKGRHSSSGRGVLIREIYLFVVHRFGPRIEKIEEAPDAVRLGGEAIRGHFHVTLKGP